MNEICLLNDSFPPLIDGVSNAVVNYANILRSSGVGACVVTPSNPDAEDDQFDFPVIRYPGLDLRKSIGYTAGNPFYPPVLNDLKKRDLSLVHSHCPVMSNFLARMVSRSMDIPLVLTYHTKFDIDITNVIKSKGLQHSAIKALVDSVGACDELWVVSEGTGKSIQSLGYEGDYIVMPNGVDVPRGRSTEEEIASATEGYDLPREVPMFLFVGRMMWYKGLKIILDAMDALKNQGFDFRMVFIGSGVDEQEVRSYSQEHGLGDKVFFTGAIRDRALLRAWYCRADLFLFPSTYDTNGLVAREAAACSLASVLVKGSCAAEGVTDGLDGFLIGENAASLAVCLVKLLMNKETMHQAGAMASQNLYISWEDSVHRAMERYQVVLDNYAAGKYERRRKFSDNFLNVSAKVLETFDWKEKKRQE